jgi:hypothetical protein
MERAYQAQRQREQQVPMDEIDRLEAGRKALPPSWVPAWAEVPAAMGSAMASSTAGGLSALGTMGLNALGLSDADPGKVLESIQQGYTYAPRTAKGMGALYGMGKAFEALHAPVARAADMTLGATGSPALATAVDVGPTALGALMGLPNAAGRGAMAAARSVVPETLPSRPGLGLGMKGQQGIIAPAHLAVDQDTLKRALAMQAAGAAQGRVFTGTDVWLNYPHSPTPGGIPLAEIPDSLENVTMRNIGFPPDPAEVDRLKAALNAAHTKYTYAEARQNGLSHEEAIGRLRDQPGVMEIDPRMPPTTGSVVHRMNLLQNQLERLTAPVYGDTIGELIHHPSLFEKFPRLKDVKFKEERSSRFAGKYDPDRDTISLNTDYNHRGPLFQGQSLIHEVGHALQHHYGLPGGANPMSARSRLTQARDQGLVSDRLYWDLMDMPSDDVYHRAWGEGLSNAAMNAVGWDSLQRKATPPWLRMTDNQDRILDPNEFWIPPR